RSRLACSCPADPRSGIRVEEVRLLRPRPQVDALASLWRMPALGAGDELDRLAADLGDAEDVGVRADLLDELDLGGDAGRSELEGLGAETEDEARAPVRRGLARHGNGFPAEGEAAAFGLDGDEVHGRRADEPGHEGIDGSLVELL